MKTTTIAKMKEIQKEKKRYWFDGSAFFNTIIETPSKKNFFITSEYMELDDPKRYSIRYFIKKTGCIETVGNFQKFENLEDAKNEMDILIRIFNNVEKTGGFLEKSIIANLDYIKEIDGILYTLHATIDNEMKFMYLETLTESVSF